MKNILIIGYFNINSIGGKEQYNRLLVENFKDKYNFFYAYNRYEKEEFNCTCKKLKYSYEEFKNSKFKSRIFRFIESILYKRKQNINTIKAFKKICKENKIDLIINSEFLDFKSFNNIPIINVQHMNDFEYTRRVDFFEKILRWIIYKRQYKNYFVCFTEESANKMKINKKKRFIINLSSFKKNEIIADNEIKKKKKITFVSRINPIKNIEFLYKVHLILKEKYDLGIDFYGPDDMGFFSENKCNNFHGSISNKEVKKILRESKMLVQASLSEGFPYIVVESLSLGTPCVVLDTYTNAKYLIEDSRGILVDKDSIPEEFAKKIVELYNLDENKYKEISKQCKSFAIENLSQEVFVEKWSKIFEKFLH